MAMLMIMMMVMAMLMMIMMMVMIMIMINKMTIIKKISMPIITMIIIIKVIHSW
jgi:hypothetical protein